MRVSKKVLFLFLCVASGTTRAEVLLKWTGFVGVPGKEVNVTLSLEKMEGAGLATLKARIKLPPQLEFVRAKLGISAEMAGVKLKVEPRDPPEIELEAGPSGIPEGVLASIDLKLKPDAKIGTAVKVEPEVTAKSTQGQDTAVKSEVEEIQIVETEPVVSCFFYMH
ncbi:MAG: hypothetical protein HY315_03245 [Acidobacteria bacterium]|nr:hypothetical protein [Acidobacteriota bacterium]